MPVTMKYQIASTFAQMAQQKPVDKITVKELVTQCGISRQSFYYHFRDILEVMEWSIQQMMNHALENSLKADNPEQSIEEFIRVAAEHQTWLMRLQASQRRSQVEAIFVQAMRANIQQTIFTKRPDLAFNHPAM